jgi:hypothetical protein
VASKVSLAPAPTSARRKKDASHVQRPGTAKY